MSFVLLSLCLVTVLQLTSSQSTYDVTQRGDDFNSCPRTEHAMCELVTEVSRVCCDMAIWSVHAFFASWVTVHCGGIVG